MRTTVPVMEALRLLVALGLLVALASFLSGSLALAEPGWGNTTEECLDCHKTGDYDIPFYADAIDAYHEAHDSSVGECLTCHEYEGESIHGPWTETPEACARCHRTHSAVEDDLLTMGKDELCLFCHGSAAGLAQTNVLEGILRSTSEPLRGGGFEQATMNTDTNVGDFDHGEWMFPVGSGAAGNVTSKHTLGVDARIWGSWNDEGFSATPDAGDTNTSLQCVSCHDPHAYGMTYRMLTRRPEGAGVAKHPGNTSDPWEQRVFVTDQLTYAEHNPMSDILSYTTEDYSNLEIGNKTWDGDEWVVTKLPDTTYAAPDVLDDDGAVIEVYYGGTPYPMYSQQLTEWCASCHDRYHAVKVGYTTPGSTDSGDAIFAYRHKTGDDPPVWDPVDERYESNSCGWSCHNSRHLNCLECHVAHGTISDMTPYVTAMPWPGEGGGGYDQLGNGTHLGEGWLEVDPTLGGNATDWDDDIRSNLLRIDNRGVCQNPACHPKGTASYLDAYDDH
ncbi:MAG: hypothetical protein E3J81_03260 [Dehalococcoidia bacterium]|nr:MAG: hypothetical protein E3J81_03260 [Dehalococcoidia bacterium]